MTSSKTARVKKQACMSSQVHICATEYRQAPLSFLLLKALIYTVRHVFDIFPDIRIKGFDLTVIRIVARIT